MIENIKNTVIALEALNIPSRLKAVEDRPFGISMGGGNENGLTSPVQDADIASAATWDSKQPGDATLTSIALLGTAANKTLYTTGIDTWAETAISAFGRDLIDDAAASNARTTLGLGSVENTALSTWAGSASITTLGTIGTGVWNGTDILVSKLNLGQDSATTAAEEGTTSTTFTDLGTVGPTITYVPSVNTTVLLLWTAKVNNSVVGGRSFMGVDISDATTVAVADATSAWMRVTSSSDYFSITGIQLVTLTAGSNTIRVKYRVDANTGTFANRTLIMIPLG